MYIKLQMYLFLKWRLHLITLMRANPLLGPLEGVGHENLDSFGPKKVKIFQGPPLVIALVMDLPATNSLRPAPYKQQVHK